MSNKSFFFTDICLDASLATSRSVNDVPSSSQHTTEFEDTTKVFGDQQASTATKKHLKDNPFGRKILDGTRQETLIFSLIRSKF